MLRRFIALLLLALAIPVVWLQGPARTPYSGTRVTVEEIPVASPSPDGAVTLEGLWKLTSRQPMFGGFSGVVMPDDGALRLFGDYGYTLRLPRSALRDGTIFAPLVRVGKNRMRKSASDIEAAVLHDGTVWLALEGRNAIVRYDMAMQEQAKASPAAMAGWGGNGGAESLARLADGRFLALREGWPWWFTDQPIEGALFDRDPTAGATGRSVAIAGNGAFRPVDMTVAPDGRLLVLLRRMTPAWPIAFGSRLALLDPADLSDGAARLELLVDLDGLLPADNYEGIAVRAAGDTWTVWLVSDDNGSHYQSSWLAQLSLDPAKF